MRMEGGVHFSPPLPPSSLRLKCRLLNVFFSILKVKKYVDDPLNWHGGMKAGWASAMLDAMDKIQSESSTIKMPYFLGCGSADQVVLSDSSKYLDKHTQSEDQTFKVTRLPCNRQGLRSS